MRKKLWVAGILTAGLGVVFARVVPRWLEQPGLKLASYLLGVALALAGLAFLLYGMRRPS